MAGRSPLFHLLVSPVLMACTQPQTHVGEDQDSGFLCMVCQLPCTLEGAIVWWYNGKRYIKKVGPPGLDNPIGLGLPPDPLGQVQFFTRAPPRYLPHSWLPEAGWWNWVCIGAPLAGRQAWTIKTVGSSSLVFVLFMGCGAKAYVPKVSCPTGTKSPSEEEQSKQLGLS